MDEGAFDCSICQDKLSEAVETRCCHHCYCKPNKYLACIKDWLTRSNSCPSCRKILTHKDLTPNVPMQRLIDNMPGECPNIKRGCTSKLTRGNIKAHVLNSCEFVEVLCLNECGITVYKKDLVSHQRQSCSKRLTPCIHCNLMIPLDIMPDHHSTSCPKTRISCPNCKTLLVRENMLRHQQRECNKIELTCPFGQFGCTFKGLRPAFNTHMVEDSDLHVGIVIERESAMAEEIGKLRNELEKANNKPQQENVFGGNKFGFFESPPQQKTDSFVFPAPKMAQPAPPSPFGTVPQFNVFGQPQFGGSQPKPAQEAQPQPFPWNSSVPNNSNGNNYSNPFVFKF